jgi:2-octaprenyl-6-methoxyphenol hydroxylase
VVPTSVPQAQVLGAGPTGSLAALALAQAGWRVQLDDPLSAEALACRSRAYALTHSSRTLLQHLGIWEPLLPHLAPFRRLELCDRATGDHTSFTGADLPRSSPRDTDPAVGWILQHQPLMQVLLQALHQQPAVALQLGDAALRRSGMDLVVAADGHRSPCRQAAGLRHWSRPYRQGCLTVQVGLRGSAPDQAWELFRPQGPFAVLPLGGQSFQLVWSAPWAELRRLEQLEPVAFLEALTTALPETLQPEVLLDQPRAFPLALELAWPLHRGPVVLVGETAHRSHPVGGQGLNLCWRDVQALHQLAQRVVAGRLAVRRLPRRYARRRGLDIVMVLLATDALVRLFSNRNPLLLPLRRLALAALARSPMLRRLSLGAMTLGPCGLLPR